MRGRRLYAVLVTILVFAIVAAWWVHTEQRGHELLVFIAETVGFWIALLALGFAVATYASIDSVDAISRMDGNILDNEHYVTCMPELLREFQAEDADKLRDQLFESMEVRLRRRSHSAIEFADTLQHLVDLIVLFPAVFHAAQTSKVEYNQRMMSLIRRLDRRARMLNEISKGSSIQISETIKLFKGVVGYQKRVAEGNFNLLADLLMVRGSVLRNPVTRTVFHNYLGLYYNKKAMELILQEVPGPCLDPLSIAYVKLLHSSLPHISPKTRENVVVHLDAASIEFDKATHASADDPMWPGFIQYNKARTLFFRSVITGEANPWSDTLDAAISARIRLNGLIVEILRDEVGPNVARPTHLQTFFAYQEELARLIKLNLFLGGPAISRKDATYRGEMVASLSIDELQKKLMPVPQFHIIGGYHSALLEEVGAPSSAVAPT
ncbi:MAG: hypothetical protein ACREO4_09805 [Lysobacter sp.]